ncbi:hypothetical protein N0B31_16500 [Salinirubellus salinus]|uniref:Uncharacterized protein n=1 Tax=Salinirubellus salinus TaxID=1364945 RepID=A0A9E7R326_9EURY|nr:hypothetical protein [Salinirubellus salinus]UWM53725.1 hypothetical protein N0B31_16500 [Salinirubellus salinus]
MALRHWLLVLAVVGVVTTGAGGTGAFSSATAERGVSVAVAPPEDAFLGLTDSLDATVPENGTRADLLTVTNRLNQRVDLTAEVFETDPDGGPNVTNVSVVLSLEPGEGGPVSADLACDSNATESVTVTVDAVGTGVRVENASRPVELTCS